MIHSKGLTAFVALLMALLVALTAFAIVRPDAVAPLVKETNVAYATAFDKTKVLSIEIVAAESDWQQMLENATQEAYIRADVVIDGKKITNVGIRPKGNSSLSMVAANPDSDRYSFKIEFDHFIEGQTWYGLDKLAVNNMQGDATYMKEYISYDIMESLGVKTPLFAFADISVNGAKWGFYLAVEVMEDAFLHRNYDGEGKLYKPESMGGRGEGRMRELVVGDDGEAQNGNQQRPDRVGDERAAQVQPNADTKPTQPNADADQAQPNADAAAPEQRNFVFGGGGPGGGFGMASNGVSLVYTDDDPTSYSAIFDNAIFPTSAADKTRVVRALKGLSEGKDLEQCVDVDACLRYFAAMTFVVNLDSYASQMGHNYYLYENGGKIAMLPWDFNLAFGGFMSGDASSVVHFPIDTPLSGATFEDRPLIGQLLSDPTYLAQYHTYLRQIVEGYWQSGRFASTLDSLTKLISDHVKNDPSAFVSYDEYTASLPVFEELVDRRAESVSGQLDGSIPSTTDGQNADKSALFDTSSIDLQALGSQGGGMRMAFTRQGDGGENGAPMQFAFEGAPGDLSEEDIGRMREMGMPEEAIAAIQKGERPQGMPGPGGQPGQGGPGAVQGGNGQNAPLPGGEMRGFTGETQAQSSGLGAQAAIELGACVACLALALVFAAKYQRRPSA